MRLSYYLWWLIFNVLKLCIYKQSFFSISFIFSPLFNSFSLQLVPFNFPSLLFKLIIVIILEYLLLFLLLHVSHAWFTASTYFLLEHLQAHGQCLFLLPWKPLYWSLVRSCNWRLPLPAAVPLLFNTDLPPQPLIPFFRSSSSFCFSSTQAKVEKGGTWKGDIAILNLKYKSSKYLKSTSFFTRPLKLATSI